MKINRKTRALLNRRALLRKLHIQCGYHCKRLSVWEARLEAHKQGTCRMPASLVEMAEQRVRFHDRESDRLLMVVARAEKPYIGNHRLAPILSMLEECVREDNQLQIPIYAPSAKEGQ